MNSKHCSPAILLPPFLLNHSAIPPSRRISFSSRVVANIFHRSPFPAVPLRRATPLVHSLVGTDKATRMTVSCFFHSLFLPLASAGAAAGYSGAWIDMQAGRQADRLVSTLATERAVRFPVYVSADLQPRASFLGCWLGWEHESVLSSLGHCIARLRLTGKSASPSRMLPNLVFEA